MLDDLPSGISDVAGALDAHLRLLYWICGIWFAAVLGTMVYLLWRYRRRAGVRAAWMPAETARARAWVLVPAALVLVFDLVIEWDSSRLWARVKEDVPAEGMLVRVTGRQYSWTFQYAGPDRALDTPDDFLSFGELHVPRGRTIRFQLESGDVLHSFFVPALRLKQDAVPGRSIPGWFQADREGSYVIACAELCGVAHTVMQGRLVVQSPEDFEAWAAAQGRMP